LFAARAIVGLGEAGYGSAGAALIANLFPARMRGGLLAAFFASASVGSVLGVMLGGLIAAQWGWQSAFGVVGLPGLVLALLYLRVRDYRTVALEEKESARTPGSGSLTVALRSLFSSRTLLSTCLGSAAQLIVVSSIWAWLPSYLGRFHGVTPAVAGVRAALVVLLGAAGSMIWGIVIDRVGAEQPRCKLYGLAVLCVATLLFLIPTFASTGLSNSAQLILIAIGGFVMTCAVGPAAAIVMDVTHAGLRATGASVLSLFQNLLGLAAGPGITGALSDSFGLDKALTVIPLFSALAAVLFLVASRTYETDIQRRTTAPAGSEGAWVD
jgi:MFS family permease